MFRVFNIFVSLLIGTTVVIAQPSPALNPQPSNPRYAVQALDFIQVTVYDEADLNVQQRIDSDGQIRVPLLGNVNVNGMTVREIEERLERLFRQERYLRNPHVTVAVTSFSPREVLLLGEIGRRGPLQLPQGQSSIDIVDLVARAGDFTGIANRDEVMVKRTFEDGTVREFIVDVEDIILNRERGVRVNSFEVQEGDIVYVPERLF